MNNKSHVVRPRIYKSLTIDMLKQLKREWKDSNDTLKRTSEGE